MKYKEEFDLTIQYEWFPFVFHLNCYQSIPIYCAPLNGSFDYHRGIQYDINMKSLIDKALNEICLMEERIIKKE